MNGKKNGELKTIIIYWWNFGTKTLDFKGTIKDFLALKNIKVTRITSKISKDVKGYRFKINVSSTIITLDTFDSDYAANADKAIISYLTLLGDKTKYSNGYGSWLNINWR